MKKFRFSLETVLDYKQQALDALRAEHGAILAQVRAQEDVVDGLEGEQGNVNEEYLRALEREIQEERRKLAILRRREEQKRTQVVEARKETATLEKLKEHKLDDYRRAEQKAEEQLIEEFVSTTRAMAAMGM